MTARRTLVAGIGNVFLGDDGFGVEVVRRLSSRVARDDVAVPVAAAVDGAVALVEELLEAFDA